MLFRSLTYIVLGWVLLAAVPAFGHVFSLTIMLPSTSAVLLTHLAFSREGELPWGLAVATALGYLEDLHQGAPIGTLALAHGLTYLALRWASGRVALHGWVTRALAAMVAIGLVDLATWGVLMSLSVPRGIDQEALNLALGKVGWHVLATVLVAQPVWGLTDWLFKVLRLERSPAPALPPPVGLYPRKRR
jgi:hypothetical protein